MKATSKIEKLHSYIDKLEDRIEKEHKLIEDRVTKEKFDKLKHKL